MDITLQAAQGPDGSVDPFAARAIASYKTTPFSFKKGQIVNVLRKQTDPNGICLYYGECKNKAGWFPDFYVKKDLTAKVELNPIKEDKSSKFSMIASPRKSTLDESGSRIQHMRRDSGADNVRANLHRRDSSSDKRPSAVPTGGPPVPPSSSVPVSNSLSSSNSSLSSSPGSASSATQPQQTPSNTHALSQSMPLTSPRNAALAEKPRRDSNPNITVPSPLSLSSSHNTAHHHHSNSAPPEKSPRGGAALKPLLPSTSLRSVTSLSAPIPAGSGTSSASNSGGSTPSSGSTDNLMGPPPPKHSPRSVSTNSLSAGTSPRTPRTEQHKASKLFGLLSSSSNSLPNVSSAAAGNEERKLKKQESKNWGVSGGRVFATRLDDLLSEQMMKLHHLADLQVPLFVRRATRHIFLYGLSEEGVFRVPGVSDRIEQIFASLDMGEDVAFGKEEFVYNACDLLKRYCKNMTPPLLLHENAQSLYDAMDVVETEAQIKAMRDELWKLPHSSRLLLKEMCALLQQTMSNSSVNRMDATALVLMWAPNLVRSLPKKEPEAPLPKTSAAALLALSGGNAGDDQRRSLTLFLIQHAHDLFGEPDFTLDGRADNHWLVFRNKFVLPVRAADVSCGQLCDPHHLWLSTAEGNVHIYDIAKPSVPKLVKGGKGAAAAIVPLRQHTLMCGTAVILVRDATTGEVLKELTVAGKTITGTCAVDSETAWIAFSDKTISVFHSSKLDLVRSFSCGDVVTSMLALVSPSSSSASASASSTSSQGSTSDSASSTQNTSTTSTATSNTGTTTGTGTANTTTTTTTSSAFSYVRSAPAESVWIACADCKMRILDAKSGEVSANFSIPATDVSSLEYMSRGGYVFGISKSTSKLFLWNEKSRLLVHSCAIEKGISAAVSLLSNIFIATRENPSKGADRSVLVFNTKDLSILGEFSAYHTEPILQLQKLWNPKRKRWQLLTLSADKSILFYDLKLSPQQQNTAPENIP